MRLNQSWYIMLSLALAALLSVAVGHLVPHNCELNPALLYSGHVLPVPFVHFAGAAGGNGRPFHVGGAPQPVQPTAAVAQATAEFMASWNAAADRARQIQTTIAPSGHVSFGAPRQVQETEDVRRATAEFMAAWNTAAQRASAVEAGINYGVPKPVQPTPEVQRATAEFMTAWHNAAQRAATVHAALSAPTTYSAGLPRQVEPTEEVRRATEDFMKAWHAAAARVPQIQNTMYQVSGIHASGAGAGVGAGAGAGAAQPVKFTPEVERATAEFMAAFNKAAALAAAAPDHDVSSLPLVTYSAPVASQTYTGPLASGDIMDSGYTKEVDEARRKFQKAYDAIAARTATAPHTGMSYYSSGAVADASGHSLANYYSGAGVGAVANSGAGRGYDGPQASGVITPSGYTKEVADARREFQQAFNAAAARAAYAFDIDDGYYNGHDADDYDKVRFYVPAGPSAYAQAFSGPQASGVITSSGYTKEVEEARRAFQQAFDAAVARTASGLRIEYDDDYYFPGAGGHSAAAHSHTYSGPHASGVITASGYTQEVDEARREFEKAYNAAAALAAAAPDTDDYTSGHAAVHYSGPTTTYSTGHHAQTYSGPLASGVITASGFTQEVDAARRQFLATFNKVAAQAPASSSVVPSRYGTSHYSVSSSAGHAGAAAGPQYSGPFASGTIAPSGYTVEVDEARRQFMKAYDAAAALAAKTPDYSVVTYSASTHAGAPQPVGPTPEVAKATAEFMAAWNAAAARAATIESTLVRSTPASHASISLPTHAEALETLRRANEEFMAAWNAAARRVSSVQQAVTYGLPKPVQPTAEVQRATAEFMAAWQAAARRVPKINQAVTKAASYSTGLPQQVQATAEVQRATAEFMAAWNAAAARVPKIETSMYSAAQSAVGGPQQLLNLIKSAEQTAVQPSGSVGFVPFGVDTSFANNVGTNIAYAGTTAFSPATVSTLKTFPLSHRLFAPVQGLPLFYNCECD